LINMIKISVLARGVGALRSLVQFAVSAFTSDPLFPRALS
jgi:hypothetical protein